MTKTYYLSTLQRRAMQKLWTSLDQYLTPYLNEGFILAVSGGPDSRALLESTASWTLRTKTRIMVVSLDHSVRNQSRMESFLALGRAKRLGFEIASKRRDSKKYIGENELRSWRYETLFEISKKENLKNIVLAHHKNDNSENYLMSLLGIGGGNFGAAIKPITEMGESNRLIRPFLSLSKSELVFALTANKMTNFAIDNYDEESHGQRALIRNNIMPKLLTVNPHIQERLDYFANRQLKNTELSKNLAKNMVEFRDDKAYIALNNNSDEVMRAAIKEALRKITQNKDLRSGSKTLENILHLTSSIDQTPNCTKIAKLKGKEFMFSGAVIRFDDKKLKLVVEPHVNV